MSLLNLSLIQTETHWHSIADNLKHFEVLINSINYPTDIILLPEAFTTGFTLETQDLSENMEGSTVEWLLKMAEQTGALIMGSAIIEENNSCYNRLLCAFPGGVLKFYDKRHLFAYSDEDKVMTPGDQRLILNWKGFRIMPLVCYDLRFPVWSRNMDEYDLLIYVANWPKARFYAWRQLLIARAIENQSYVAGVNRVGKDGRDLDYGGGSCMISYDGSMIADLENKQEIKTVEISLHALNVFRNEYPFLRDKDRFQIIT